MSLGGRLARLERQAGRVVRCAWCRYHLINDFDVKARGGTPSRDFVWRSCRWCGHRFKDPLDSLTPKQRETYLLWAYTFDGETYRDERAFAAEKWWVYHATLSYLLKPPKRRVRDDSRKPDRYERGRAELKAEADRLVERAREQQERLYGPRTFPLVATLGGIEEGLEVLDQRPYSPGFVYYPEHEKRARRVLIYARCMEACELVLWGEAEPETLAEIEARSAEVAAFEEVRERERREREEKERREREERERKRLERLEGQRRAREEEEERRRRAADFWLSEGVDGESPVTSAQGTGAVVRIPAPPAEPSRSIAEIIAEAQEGYRLAAERREAEERERRYLRRHGPR
jgi:hypothetical protein